MAGKPPFCDIGPKSGRLFWRKAVTIVAGFRCNKGVVLCADTQETVGTIYKRHVPKLRFEETTGALAGLNGVDLAVAFCGATNNGAFVDKLVDSAWKAAKNSDNIDDVCNTIEDSIQNTYRHFGQIYQLGSMPTTELIYGVKMGGESRLFNTLDAVVNEKQNYCTGGVGTYLADFLAARMYSEGLTVQQCVILAAYILFQTKEHVDGCGGKSHIAVLREDGASGIVDLERVDSITSNMEKADRHLGPFLLASSNLDMNDEEFSDEGTGVIEVLKMFRDEQRTEFEKWDKFKRTFDSFYGLRIKRDQFGLMQSIEQTEEPEQ